MLCKYDIISIGNFIKYAAALGQGGNIMNLYARYQDKEETCIILNRKYSIERIEEKLWTRTNLSEEQIEEIIQEGIFLEKNETLQIRVAGRAIVTTDERHIITLLGDKQRIVFYPNASFERKYSLGDKIEDWFLDNVKKVKKFFFA